MVNRCKVKNNNEETRRKAELFFTELKFLISFLLVALRASAFAESEVAGCNIATDAE